MILAMKVQTRFQQCDEAGKIYIVHMLFFYAHMFSVYLIFCCPNSLLSYLSTLVALSPPQVHAMRSFIFSFLAAVLIGTAVAVKDESYLHALQTIFFYRAYRLEVVLPLEDRIIGVRCREWDNSAKKCREVAGEPTHERCPGTKKVRIPDGDLVTGVCSLREFIAHITGRGKDRVLPSLDKDTWTVHDAAETMHKERFGNGRLLPWAAIKDGGTGYISAIKTACGQVAKARKASPPNEKLMAQVKRGIERLESVIDDITLDRRLDKSKELLPILRGPRKNNWGGIEPAFDTKDGRELFNYDKTLGRLREVRPQEQQYQAAKRRLDAEIERFNAQEVTSNHNAAMKGWEDNKGLMAKDC